MVYRIPAYEDKSSLDLYLRDIRRHPVLQPKEQEELGKRAFAGDEKAREKLVVSNLRFVVSYVKKYRNQGLSMEDLVAIGNEGLLKASRKYDPSYGVKFISYGVWWIRQSIQKAISEIRNPVRIPVNLQAHFGQIDKITRAVSEQYDVTYEQAYTALRKKEAFPFPKETLDAFEMQRNIEHISFDVQYPDKKRDIAQTLRIERPSPENKVAESDLEKALTLLFSILNERERKIIRLYHGMDGQEYTLEEIGDMMDITRERVRQIKERAFEKLRANPAFSTVGRQLIEDL